MMSSRKLLYHVKFHLHLYRSDEGGREHPIVTGYRPTISNGRVSTDIYLKLLSSELSPGQTKTVIAAIHRVEKLQGFLSKGEVFKVYEGNRVVGKIKLTKLLGYMPFKVESSIGQSIFIIKDKEIQLEGLPGNTGDLKIVLQNASFRNYIANGFVYNDPPVSIVLDKSFLDVDVRFVLTAKSVVLLNIVSVLLSQLYEDPRKFYLNELEYDTALPLVVSIILKNYRQINFYISRKALLLDGVNEFLNEFLLLVGNQDKLDLMVHKEVEEDQVRDNVYFWNGYQFIRIIDSKEFEKY